VIANGPPEQSAAAPKVASALTPESRAKAEALVAEYNAIRAQQSYGGVRTQRMTEVVGRMIHFAQQNPGWDLAALLDHADRGWRLFGYACLYARPDFALFGRLVTSAAKFVRDNHQFGTYWAIVAMQRVVAASEGHAVPDAVRLELQRLAWQIEPLSDRDAEMRRLLATLKELPRQ